MMTHAVTKILLLLVSLATLNAQAPAPALPTTVFNWDQLIVKKTAKGERRDIVDRRTATFRNFESHVTTLRAGEEAHPPHTHADEEIVIVKDGTLEVTHNGRTERAPAGSVIFYAAGDRHGMRNVGGTTASYYVLRLITADTPAAAPAKK